MIFELERLRAAPYRRLGTWSLPQACWHLAKTIEDNLTPPPTDEPTPDETATREKFFGMVFGPSGMPTGIPLPPDSVPPADCNEHEIERLAGALGKLVAYPHRCVKVGRCGPVPKADVVRLHLTHAAHHLSFLVPETSARRVGLRFANEDEAIADVWRLRRGYARTGNWTLPQACWHLDQTIQARMKPGPFPPNSPEQEARRPIFEKILATGQLPSGLEAPEPLCPPPDCGDEAIDGFIATITRFRDFPGPVAPHRLFGHMPDDVAHRQNLIHVAHHLGFFVPID